MRNFFKSVQATFFKHRNESHLSDLIYSSNSISSSKSFNSFDSSDSFNSSDSYDSFNSFNSYDSFYTFNDFHVVDQVNDINDNDNDIVYATGDFVTVLEANKTGIVSIIGKSFIPITIENRFFYRYQIISSEDDLSNASIFCAINDTSLAALKDYKNLIDLNKLFADYNIKFELTLLGLKIIFNNNTCKDYKLEIES